MTKWTPGKRRAREIQRETGQPYTACLRIALSEIAEQQPDAPDAPETAAIEPPSSSGLFSHA